MYNLNYVKKRVRELFENNPEIHVNVRVSNTNTKTKTTLSNIPVTIIGVYPFIFMIEETYYGRPRRHSIQYNDIISNHFEIIEL